MAEENDPLWRQFIHLGDMMGDGLHHEEPWISREYKKLARILIPEVKEAEQKRRKAQAEARNKQMAELIKTKKCHCGGSLVQKPLGTKVARCTKCNAKFVARVVKK